MCSKVRQLTTLSIALSTGRRWYMNERVWNNGGIILRGETEVVGQKLVRASIFSPHVPREPTFDRSRGYAVRTRRLTCLIHGMTSHSLITLTLEIQKINRNDSVLSSVASFCVRKTVHLVCLDSVV